jgi:hypothetical protein
MPKIHGYSLPALVKGKLWAMVSEFGDTVYEPSCGTIVAEGSTVKSLQEQMIATIQTENEFSQPLLEVLQRALPYRATVEALSQKIMIQCFDGLCQLLGQTEVILAMLVDTRLDLRAFAAEQLKKEPHITVGLSEGQWIRLQNSVLDPLHQLLGKCHGSGEINNAKNETKLIRKVAALEEEVKQLKKSKQRRVERLTAGEN